MTTLKIGLILIAAFLLNSAQAFEKLPVIKTAYNGRELSVQKSQSWKFTVNFSTNKSSCTGFFISRTKMITAEHCFDKDRTIKYLFFFRGSEYYSYLDLDYINVTASVRTHSYRDVAVVDFSQEPAPLAGFYDLAPVTTVSRRHFNYFDELRGKKLHISGTGINNKNKSNYLSFVTGFYTSSYGDKIRMKTRRGQGICSGDSGSPVTFSDARDGLVVVGIAVSSYNTINKKCGNDMYFEILNGDIVDWFWES